MKAYEEIMKALSFYFADEPSEQMSEESIYEIIGQEHDPIETISKALDDYREKRGKTMKELKEFTVERLEALASGKIEDLPFLSGFEQHILSERRELAKIALAAKKAEPVGCFVHTLEDGVRGMTSIPDDSPLVKVATPLYTTPPLNHTEQDGWTKSDAANAALVMLDRIETIDLVDDDRIEGIKRIIHQLAAPKSESE